MSCLFILYGCENWILNQQQIKRLEATEMWFIRRMQKISWKIKEDKRTGTQRNYRKTKINTKNCAATSVIFWTRYEKRTTGKHRNNSKNKWKTEERKTIDPVYGSN